MAKVELDAVFPVLNFFASLVNFTGSMPAICLGETSGPEPVTDYALSETGHWHFQQALLRITGGFDVSDFKKVEAIQSSLKRASTMLSMVGKHKYNERLLSGMKWAGKGASARNIDEAFLFNAIALEALILGTGRDTQLSYRLRLRVGQLLGRTKAGKTTMRDLTKRLYLVRNAIAHTGKTDIASVDLVDIRYIVQLCLEIILCHDEFAAIKTDEALEDWFEDALMNAPEAASEIAAKST